MPVPTTRRFSPPSCPIPAQVPPAWRRTGGGLRGAMNHIYSAELARALFEEAGDALFLFDPDTDQLLDVNRPAEQLSGFTRDELLTYPATYLFRFGGGGGKGGKDRLRQAASKTQVFHSQEGFFLRTRQDG